MSDVQIYLCDCTRVICEEVVMGSKQMNIALIYAMAIKSQANGVDKPDWLTINRAIMSKWKMRGLERIKKRALDLLSGKVQL